MKQNLGSNPKADWEGFRPIGYWFDPATIADLPLKEKSSTSGGLEVPTTVGSIYQRFADKELTKGSLSGGVFDTELETIDGTKINVDGPSFNRNILETLLRFRADGINPFDTILYYYDKDRSRQDPQQCFSFFVVHKGKIVQERLLFFKSYNNGFDPSVFGKPDHSDPTWGDETDWEEARTRYWYQIFYSETQTGQVIALRPDKPTMFYQERPTAPDVMGVLNVIARSLTSVRLLLWALLILTIVGFLFRWR